MNNIANVDQIVPQKGIRVLESRGHGIDGARVWAALEVNGTVITNEYKWSTFREAKDAKKGWALNGISGKTCTNANV